MCIQVWRGRFVTIEVPKIIVTKVVRYDLHKVRVSTGGDSDERDNGQHLII